MPQRHQTIASPKEASGVAHGRVSLYPSIVILLSLIFYPFLGAYIGIKKRGKNLCSENLQEAYASKASNNCFAKRGFGRQSPESFTLTVG